MLSPFSPPTGFPADSASTHATTHPSFTPPLPLARRTVLRGVEATQQADGGHPAVHVLLGLRHQVPGPLLRPQVEDEAALQLLLSEGQPGVHLREGWRGAGAFTSRESEAAHERWNHQTSVKLGRGQVIGGVRLPAHTGSG